MRKYRCHPKFRAMLIIVPIFFVMVVGIGPVAGLFAAEFVGVASSERNLGILGKNAPELNLTSWIDGNGQPTASVRLTDLKGRVIYLYFFQDW